MFRPPIFPRRGRRRPGSGARGLTLVEILVVLAIISVLSALLMPAAARARLRGLVVRTEAVIAGMETALALYETDYGDYPAHRGAAGPLIALLTSETVDSELWRGPYLRLKERDLDDGELIDSWGRPFYYEYPQDRKPKTPFLFYSSGPDREPGTARDIGNW